MVPDKEAQEAQEARVIQDMKISVFCTFQLEGFHCWPGAVYSDTPYLADVHRHMFHFKVSARVGEASAREIEFISMRRQLMGEVARWFSPGKPQHYSCEDLARRLIFLVHRTYHSTWIRAEVSEDGENGAVAEGRF